MSGTFLGFDFGTKSIGVAVGQRITGTARPLPALKAQDGKPDWNIIEKLLKEWQPEKVVVGLPLNMDDTESELSARARKFARRLRHETNIETLMVDERLTTREARDELESYQIQGRAKKLAADSIAAALFIESWYRHPFGVNP